MTLTVRRPISSNGNSRDFIYGTAAVRLIVGTYFFLLAIHVSFIGLWLYHTQISYDWFALVYGSLRQTPEEVSRWDFFHWFYQWTPLSVAFLGFWELVPLTLFYMGRKKLRAGDLVMVHRKPLMTGLKLGALACFVLVSLSIGLVYVDNGDQHLALQALLVLFWGKYTLATAGYTGWQL